MCANLTTMGQQSNSTLSRFSAGLPTGRRALLQGGFFILVWPMFNVMFIAAVLHELGHLDVPRVGSLIAGFVATFTLAYALVLLGTISFPRALSEDRFWAQYALHIVAIVIAATIVGPGPTADEMANAPQPRVVPIVFTLFQITLYVVVKTLRLQRERHLAMQLNLRQAQVNVLRSQSNPHFLFNTLNLLASEIGRDPSTAREIVYDLADLLRDSMRAAEQEFITLEEEVRLATLYLTLQKKRFPERLAFEINVEDRARSQRVPSLILQPLVENVVKHVVAQSGELTTLNLSARINDNTLVIEVANNGQPIDLKTLQPGSGLRIVEETLSLHYQGTASMRFDSSGSGSRVSLAIPPERVLSGVAG